jgi:HSP20 family molecular chaperone IbpA
MADQPVSQQANEETSQRAGQRSSQSTTGAAGQQTGAAGQQVAGESGRQTGTGMSRGEDTGAALTLVPPTDIYETKDGVVMLLDMPGADPESLDVTLEKRELTISARSMISAPQGYTPVYLEYREGNYERAFTLSDQVDSERIDAMLKDGVLRLNLPKAPAAQARKIEVKSA